MKKPKPRKAHNLDALLERQALLYGLRDFRYGQLLSPNESTELAKKSAQASSKAGPCVRPWRVKKSTGSAMSATASC